MLFTSPAFVIFVLLVLPVYFALEYISWTRDRFNFLINIFLTVVSLIFYGWMEPVYILILALSGLIDFFAGLLLGTTLDGRRRRAILSVSIITNLGLLILFKYAGLLAGMFETVLRTCGFEVDMAGSAPLTFIGGLILPAGISFYTFQSMSYTIDVYRGNQAPTRDLFKFFAYLSFFPQLIAGPIERAQDFLVQFSSPKNFNLSAAVTGCYLILWGFYKKMVIADPVGSVVDLIYEKERFRSALEVLLAGGGFGIQIYCDFSGYCDIALGLALLMGFKLTTNFRKPYFSTNIRDFWRRWNISLSTWFKDYIYQPLVTERDGREKSKSQKLMAIYIVFFVSGLWHGAGFGFIIWGVLMGVGYLGSILFLSLMDRMGMPHTRLGRISGWAFTLAFVSIGWLFFRGGYEKTLLMLSSRAMSEWSVDRMSGRVVEGVQENLVNLVFFCPLLFVCEFLMKERLEPFTAIKSTFLRWLFAFLIAFSIPLFGYWGKSTFIYFQF